MPVVFDDNSIRRRLLTWGLVFCVWWGLGLGLGAMLDAAFWNISFNYVYSPLECTRWFGRWSLPAAAVMAAGATTGRSVPARMNAVAGFAAVCAVGSFLCGLIWAAAGAWLSDSASTAAATTYLAPLRRVRFCEGLWNGTAAGFAATSVAILINLFIRRADAERPLDETTQGGSEATS